jgi:carbon-monoxide dehydrogenase small subunit
VRDQAGRDTRDQAGRDTRDEARRQAGRGVPEAERDTFTDDDRWRWLMAGEGAVHAIDVTVNGTSHTVAVPARRLLVHFIRETLGLRGTHIGCDTGNCGACSVICDGQLIKSCMMLAVQADGCEIETIESLGEGVDGLDPIQEAFKEHHGLQCGYCTPGIVLNAKTLLAENPHPTEAEIRRALKGNICRCTGYVNIIRSIVAAAGAQGEVTR